MTTKTRRKSRNSKIYPTCEYCGKICSDSYLHVNCIIEYLQKHDYFVLDLNFNRVFGLGSKK